jgi:SAM-dependent methyltransferase
VTYGPIVAESSERCPACGAPALRPWRRARAADARSSRPVYDLLRCTECGTARVVGRTEADATALYRGGAYARPSARIDAALEPMRRLATRSACRALGELPAGAAVCDVGAGDGRLVRALRERGYHAVGIDPFAEEAPVRASLDAAGLPAESFDAVVFWHVLEHLDEPEAALREAGRIAKPGGRIVVAVPNLDSLQARLGGDLWFHQDVPRHAVHFSEAGLRALLARVGLALERLHTVTVDQNLLGMTQTLLNRLTGDLNAGFRTLKGDVDGVPRRSRVISAVAVVPAAVVGTAVESAATLAGRGGSLVARARRP